MLLPNVIWCQKGDLTNFLTISECCRTKFFPQFFFYTTHFLSWSMTKISILVEASALSSRCWMSQSSQCLGAVLPLAMFISLVVAVEQCWVRTQSTLHWCLRLLFVSNIMSIKNASVTLQLWVSVWDREWPQFQENEELSVVASL